MLISGLNKLGMRMLISFVTLMVFVWLVIEWSWLGRNGVVFGVWRCLCPVFALHLS